MKPSRAKSKPVSPAAPARRAPKPPPPVTPSPTAHEARLVHERQVHQIELEAQNEELRRAQHAVQAAHARYFDLYDLAPVGYLTVNERGVIVGANLTAAQLLGVDKSQLIQQRLARWIAPADQDNYYLHARNLDRTGESQEFELRMRQADGAHVWVRVQTNLAQDEHGALVRRVILSDITKRKRAEEQLEKSEARLREAEQIAQWGYFELDLATRQATWSAGARQIFGLSELDGALTPKRMRQLVHPDDVESVFAAFDACVAGQQPFEIECRIVRADGVVRHLHSIARTKTNAPADATTFFGTVQDVTERYHMEEALRQSEERFRVAQELSLDAFTILQSIRDERGAIVDFEWTYANAMAGKLLKQPPEKLVGRRLLHVLPSNRENRALFERYVRIAEGGPPDEVELEYRGEGIAGWFRNMTVRLGDGVAVSFSDITEHKRMELALAESEKRYRSIVEDQTELICRFRSDNTLTFVNEAYARYFGKTSAELIGSSFLPLIPPEDQPIIAAQTSQLSIATPVVSYRHRVILPNGETRWQHWMDRALFDEHGNLTEYQSVGRDITEQKRIEDALRESEQRYRLLFEQSPDATFILDLQGNHQDANSRAAAMLGYTHEELLGQSLRQVSAEVPASQRIVERLVAGERIPTYERLFRRKDGDVFPVELTVDLVRDLNGTPVGIQSIARDITERKRIEKELAITLTKYKTLFEMFPLGITIADAQGNIIETNRVAEKLSGVPAAEHLERDIDGPEWQIIRLDGTPMPPDEYAGVRALKEQRRIENVEMGIVKSPHETTWINVTAAPLPLEGYGVVIAYSDISARLDAEHALRESEARYRLLADASSDVIWTCDLNLELTYVSPAFERLTGYTPRQAPDLSFATALTPDSLERANILFTEAAAEIAQPSAQGFADWSNVAELEMRRKDGSTVWTETQLNFILDARANPRAILGITRDISERKRAEAERANQRRAHELARVYQATRDLSVILDLAVLLETIGQRACNLLGASAGAIYLRNAEQDTFELRASCGAFSDSMAMDGRAPAQPRILTANPRIAQAPLQYGDELFGVLVVGDPHAAGSGLAQADLHLLILFAGQAAAALHNIHMFERVRASREHAHILAQQLLNAQETERRAIARELHDEIGQALTSVQLSLQNIESFLPEGDAQDTLEETMRTVERVLDQARDLSRSLRPAMLDDFGLVPALRWYLQRQAKRAGFQSEFDAEPFATRLPEEVETVCFRIAQEAITNIVRHARADHVAVQVRAHEGMLNLTIRDNGIGFDLLRALNESFHGESIGLLGIKERVTLIGGDVSFRTAPGQGTEIRVRLPLTAEATLGERRQAERGDP